MEPRGENVSAVSVHMKSLHNAGEVESETTSRTMTDLEGKPEEENSMSLKRRAAEGMYSRRSASPVRTVRLGLSNLSSTR